MAVKASTTLIVVIVFGVSALLLYVSAEQEGENSFVRVANKNTQWNSHYDYIIVGGGTAGCPLAATLSQNATVLVLERGGSPYGNDNISRIENFQQNLLNDDGHGSTTQKFVSEDGVQNQRARVLGGNTCINAGFYSHASHQEIREMGLKPDLVEESYRWVESKVVHRPPRNEWQLAIAEGLVESGITPFNGFTYEHIPGTKIGGTTFNKSGYRSTAADLLRYSNPATLTVLLYASVQRILFQTEGTTNPKAYGVAFTDVDGTQHEVFLNEGKSEVILAAGALGSPQLLMLSGIGPREHLQSLGINVLINQPAVGQGMTDNPANWVLVASPIPVNISLPQTAGITDSGNYIEAIGRLGISKKTQIKNGGLIFEKVARALSRGYLRLRNTNVRDNPLVRFNYFQDPQDLETCVQGVKVLLDVINSEPMKRFMFSNLSLAQVLNFGHDVSINWTRGAMEESALLQQFCRKTVSTIWHYHGGCQVGSVVNEEYKVFDVDNVRVIDGSTFLFSPGTNPQATVMMLGRFMGVKILRERIGQSK